MRWRTRVKGEIRIVRRFAWFPVELQTGITVWLEFYWSKQYWSDGYCPGWYSTFDYLSREECESE